MRPAARLRRPLDECMCGAPATVTGMSLSWKAHGDAALLSGLVLHVLDMPAESSPKDRVKWACPGLVLIAALWQDRSLRQSCLTPPRPLHRGPAVLHLPLIWIVGASKPLMQQAAATAGGLLGLSAAEAAAAVKAQQNLRHRSEAVRGFRAASPTLSAC